ncbi:Do family serine endopeptidase, partial [bacterium]|nr:Do family serine endopeptidase [bacterium]
MLNTAKKKVLVLFSVGIGVLVGLVVASNFNLPKIGIAESESTARATETLTATPTKANSTTSTPINDNLAATNRAFVQVAKKVIPTVVSITSEKVVNVRNPFSDFFNNDDFFRRFFRTPDQQQEYRQQGLGSGVIVSPDGYILTNFHVIRDADEINVQIDEDKYPAQIIGTDPETDLAVVKINKRGLPAAELGDSEALEVGEWVLAIGNPFVIGLQHTVTSGIVSAKGRSTLNLGDGLTYQDFIQTDAAINPGNSGGALVNIHGELVGINTAILSGNAGGNIGIGFAIPINLAKPVMDELIAEGRVSRGYLGVIITTPNDEMSEALGLTDNKGAVINEVQRGTPADKAGLQKLDVIVELGGKKIENSQMLTNLIATYDPNETIELKVIRDGDTKYFSVKLDERPSADDRRSTDTKPKDDALSKLGLELSELTSR